MSLAYLFRKFNSVMHRFIYILLLFLVFGCGSQKETATLNDDDKIVIKNETLEYEIIIIEPGFHTWLQTQRPMSYFSEVQLEHRNYRSVVEWNRRVLSPQVYNPNLYQMHIDYDPNVHYGMEVNYTLFMYFRFFQQRYNQRL